MSGDARHASPGVRTSARSPLGREILGTLALVISGAIVCLAVIDGSMGLPFTMPRSWYVSRAVWYFVALASFVAACMVLRSRPAPSDEWRPEQGGVRFRQVILYTRAGCHLCDQAKDTLLKYRRWMPALEEVDIDTDPALRERYGTCIPVVEIDGRVRFRGLVNEVLLRRLIDGTAVTNAPRS